jgi:hypothetical protein
MLTLKGRQAVQSVLQAGDFCMAQLTPMPLDRMESPADLETLKDLLASLGDATLTKG